MNFKIEGDNDTSTGEILYWSNDDGWVDFDSATIFHTNELINIHFPTGSDNLRLALLKSNGEIKESIDLRTAYERFLDEDDETEVDEKETLGKFDPHSEDW